MQFGFVVEPMGTITPITEKTLNFPKIIENEDEEHEEMKFHCRGNANVAPY